MNYKIMYEGVAAIFISYLILMLPVVSATNINILFNGATQETVTYDQEQLVNKQITIKHNPSDITWTDVKILVTLNSASLSHTINKIYLFKCNQLTPTECVYSAPQVFDHWIDTELLWNDISEREGAGLYPQVANLFFLIKLKDINERVSWVGFWTQIRRTNYNVFDVISYQTNNIDIYVKSLEFVEPVKMYIENKLMIPFNWLEKVTFTDATKVYGVGSSGNEIEQSPPVFQTAVPSGTVITAINKDYYFIFPETSSGIAAPVTLNLNPSFECGNGFCESDLGETTETCCYDCGCENGYYCSVDPDNPSNGECKDPSKISLGVTGVSVEKVTDCTEEFPVKINLKLENAPKGLISQSVAGKLTLNEKTYSLTCSGGPVYQCETQLRLETLCGSGSLTMGPGEINLTINYYDGPNQKTKDLGTVFSGISVNYECNCNEGYYCDTGTHKCESEDAITLGITSLSSYLDNYKEGDKINLTAKIFNPPTGLVLIDASANLSLREGQVSPGTPQCTGPTQDYEYRCEIPFQIVGYSNQKSYTFDPNYLTFTVTYNDGSVSKTRDLSVRFGPISIPSQFCGDGSCNMGETPETCCRDCGCVNENDYCDLSKGCLPLDNITLSIQSVSPQTVKDCREKHLIKIVAKINNIPTDTSLDYYEYVQNGLTYNWDLQCEQITGDSYECGLTIPELEESGCSLPARIVGNNLLRLSVTFPDGDNPAKTKVLEAEFQNITVIPVYHCGDGVCESDLNENASNCCYDCPCSDDPAYGDDYYCEYDKETYLGSCLPKNQIKLVVDSPTRPITLKSCEINNEINVKLHIENKPSMLMVENTYAMLNNSNAEMFFCEEERKYGNFTYNCTLTVPSIAECTRGGVYKYYPNKVFFFVSFLNGPEKEETMTLSDDLPPITIKQNIKTVHDIIQEVIKEMRARLHKTIQIARDLFSWYKKCMDMAMVIGYLTIFGIVGVGVYGGLVKKWDIKKWGEAVEKTGLIGTELLQTWISFCELISQVYKLNIKIQELEIKMIRMEKCIEMNQHMLDTGQCKGNEERCFSQMLRCVEFGEVNDWMNQISHVMEDAREAAGRVGSAVSDIGQNLEEFPKGATANLNIQFGSEIDNKCGFEGDTQLPRSLGKGKNRGNPLEIKTCVNKKNQCVMFSLTDVKNCDRYDMKIHFEDGGKKLDLNIYSPIRSSVKGFVEQYQDIKYKIVYKVILFCDNNNNDEFDSGEEVGEPLYIEFVNNSKDCKK